MLQSDQESSRYDNLKRGCSWLHLSPSSLSTRTEVIPQLLFQASCFGPLLLQNPAWAPYFIPLNLSLVLSDMISALSSSDLTLSPICLLASLGCPHMTKAITSSSTSPGPCRLHKLTHVSPLGFKPMLKVTWIRI